MKKIKIDENQLQYFMEFEKKKSFKEGHAEGFIDGAFFIAFAYLAINFLVLLWSRLI